MEDRGEHVTQPLGSTSVKAYQRAQRDGNAEAMGHTHADLVLVGAKESHLLRDVMVDTGDTYTVAPRETLETLGAARLPIKVTLELANGKLYEAEAYALVIGIGERRAPGIAVTFEGAKPLVGVQALEALGLKVNPVTGTLEETRPKGLAYLF